MKFKVVVFALALALFFNAAACSRQHKAGNVDSSQVETELNKAGYGDIKVKVDNDKGVVTLSGDTRTPEDKVKIEEAARAAADNYIVANEIAVHPEGMESQARKVESNLDDAIKADWNALVAKNRWEKQHVDANVRNGVLTLKGDVDTTSLRTNIEKEAAKLPNVQQVVNELDVKSAKGKRKATGQSAANE